MNAWQNLVSWLLLLGLGARTPEGDAATGNKQESDLTKKLTTSQKALEI